MRWKFLAFLLILTNLSGAAQQLSDAPQHSREKSNGNAPHRYWDTPNKALLLTHAGLEAADFGITHRNIALGGRELDPIATSLCNRGTVGQLVFFGGRMAVVTGVSYALHRFGLHKAERTFILYLSGDSAWGLAYSLQHR